MLYVLRTPAGSLVAGKLRPGTAWSLVHATHMDDDEIVALAKSGAVAVLCPSTEANLGDGLFPLHDYLSAGWPDRDRVGQPHFD